MMAVSQFYIGNRHVTCLSSWTLVAATTLLLTACDHKQEEQSVSDPTVEEAVIGGSKDRSGAGALMNESAADMTEGDLSQLAQQSQDGLAIASNVLAQEAERVKDYRKAAHFQSLALMQGSLDEHLGLAILFAGAAEQHSSDSNIADLCILWGRAIWHTEYVIEHAGESADNKRLANDNREAAKLWRAEFQAKMREQGVQQKCRKSAEMP